MVRIGFNLGQFRFGKACAIILGLGLAVDLYVDYSLGPLAKHLWITGMGGVGPAVPVLLLTIAMALVAASLRIRTEQRKLGPAAIERSFFWAHSTPALLCDLQRSVVREANLAASSLFGISRAEFEGWALSALFQEPAEDLIRQALMSQAAVLVTVHVHKHGAPASCRHVKLSAFRLRETWHTEVAICCEDVTEKQQIQTMLRTLEETQQVFIRSLPVPIGLYDKRGDFVLGNACFERELKCHGLPAECPMGRHHACALLISPIAQLVGRHADTVCATHAIQALSLNLGPCGQWEIRLFPVLHDKVVHVGLLGFNVAEAARERKKAENYAALLRALASRALQVRESERAELAREIHDLIGQEVAVMTLDASRLHRLLGKPDEVSRDKARDIVIKMEQGVGAIMTTVRRLATTLRPELLNTLGLSEAAISLVSEMRARTGIRATITTDSTWVDPTADVALQLYRCLQEALTNITKHAQASRVTVTLRLEPQQRVMIIEDNGQGIGPREESDVNHLGLVGMSERVLSIDGQLTIATRPSFPGTQLWITVPVEAECV